MSIIHTLSQTILSNGLFLRFLLPLPLFRTFPHSLLYAYTVTLPDFYERLWFIVTFLFCVLRLVIYLLLSLLFLIHLYFCGRIFKLVKLL